MKYTTLNSVLNYVKVPKQEYDEGELLESAAQALRILRIPEQFEQKFCIINLINHRARLPEDLLHIEAAAYEVVSFPSALSSPNEEQGLTVTTTTDIYGNTKTVKEFSPHVPTSINHTSFEHTNTQAILKNIGLYDLPTFSFKDHYILMQPTRDPFTSMYLCDSHPIVPCSDITYRIMTDGTILSSVESGTILLSYLTQPYNEYGDMLIPDDEDLKLAISRYVLWMYWEARQNSKVENAGNNAQSYRQQWQIAVRRVRGNFAYNNINMEKLVAINERYIKVARAPHVFNYLQSYYAR